jgi:peptide/nickel transport system permease protein
VWTYITRRLLVMIPTLFGVTIVSFIVMQLAPGDPLLNQLGPGGMAGETGQTPEAYRIQKQDLKLDKPLVLNFNYFRDYSDEIRLAARYMSRTTDEVVAELADLSERPDDPENAARLRFLRSLGIDEFQARLDDPEQRPRLAEAIRGPQDEGPARGGFLRRFLEDHGIYAVPAAMDLLRSDETDLRLKLGAIRCLHHMVIDPFDYIYSREPSEKETPLVVSVWKTWWDRRQELDNRRRREGKTPEFPRLDPQRREALAQRFARIVAAQTRTELFAGLDFFDPQRLEPFRREDMPFFAEKLLDESTSLEEKVVASLALRLYLGKPLQTDLPLTTVPPPDQEQPSAESETSEDAEPSPQAEAPEREPHELVEEVAENWLLHFQLHSSKYEPGLLAKTWYTVGDTQYAHMVWRLVTFNFGRSALKTREPVGRKILDAVIVSAPLMILAQLVIYFVAVPLGIVCAVHRAKLADRLISLGLFLLYSIPPFVAGMLFLLFLCYGDYVKLFPMDGLHSDAADTFGFIHYWLDYVWHIILPVACLSLFSLAGMAMYSRTSMLDVIGQDYIRTARAKGLPEDTVIMKHALRNSLIPILTLFSNLLPAMLGGSVLIEYLFGIPGMGTLSWESIEQKDFPTLMAVIYIDAIIVMLSILLTDILYVFVDPRISFESQEAAQ